MSFEQLVRPFAARPIIKTSRVIQQVIEATAATATITWGSAGNVPVGVKQEPGVDLEVVGFNMNNCEDEWKQKGQPETEEVEVPVRTSPDGPQIGSTTVERVLKINFHKANQSNPPTNAYIASGIAESIAGLQAAMPGRNKCDSSYQYNW